MFIRLVTEAGNSLWVDPERIDVVWGEKVKTPARGGMPGISIVAAYDTIETHVGIQGKTSWVVQGDPDEIAARVMSAKETYEIEVPV